MKQARSCGFDANGLPLGKLWVSPGMKRPCFAWQIGMKEAALSFWLLALSQEPKAKSQRLFLWPSSKPVPISRNSFDQL